MFPSPQYLCGPVFGAVLPKKSKTVRAHWLAHIHLGCLHRWEIVLHHTTRLKICWAKPSVLWWITQHSFFDLIGLPTFVQQNTIGVNKAGWQTEIKPDQKPELNHYFFQN